MNLLDKFRDIVLSNIITTNSDAVNGKDKILYVPSDFITSERYYNARTTMAAGHVDIRNKNLTNWFLDKKNVFWMTKEMFLLYLNNDYKYKENTINVDSLEFDPNWERFSNTVFEWMNEYAAEDHIYKYVEDPIGPNTIDKSWLYKYYIEALSKVNKDFFNKYYYLLKKIDEDELTGLTGKPDWNPYKATLTVGSKNEFNNSIARKTYQDMLYYPEQWKELDVWRDQDVTRWNKNFRYNNEIPVWQNLGKNRIGLDRSNDGLHDGNPDRASLDNQIHGYNMEAINKFTSFQYNKKNNMTGSYT